MTVLFTMLVLLGFIAMLAHKIPVRGLPEWVAWALWSAAALVWAICPFAGK